MAKTLKHAYAGSQHIRQILANDPNLKSLNGHKKVEWSPDNNHTVEVSDEVGQWLLDNEPGDWELVESLTSVEGESSNASGGGTDDDETLETGTAPITTGRRRSSSS